jgi:glucose/arabinose dehydrogenase
MSSPRARFSMWSWTILCLLHLPALTGAATLAPGLSETRVATGLSSPTAMAFAPDGRLFVAQQGGALRVIKNDTLLAQPFVTLNVSSSGERGLLGIAFDPAFATNRYVYVYYTTATSPIHNRVSRFTASSTDPDVAAAGSETVLLDLPALSSATNHNGGAIHFGPDGKLYIAVGDNANSAHSQNLGSTFGKLLRINANGSIPSDNPFLAQTTGINQAIFALGLRNPFNFAIDPSNGRIHVNDVGQNSWEEVNHAIPGANFGWPQTEGPNPPGVAGVRYPAYAYQNAGTHCAITGAAFYRPTSLTFPAEYHGAYFFGDYCGGFIRRLDPPNYSSATEIASGISSLVDIQVGPSGSLYYLARGGGEVYRVNYTDTTGPSIVTQPQNVTVAEGQIATFSVSASGAWPLRYQWQRNGTRIEGATSSTLTVAATNADNGARYRVIVNNPYGVATSDSATLTVLNTSTPTGTITAPVNGTGYRAGQTITFSGTGTDPNDGNLPPSAFTWRVDFHHDGHIHPHMPATRGITSGTFTIPDRGETSVNVFYRVVLTVRDSTQLPHTSYVDIRPQTSLLEITSNVPGVQLTLDGEPITAPHSVRSVEGMIRTLGVQTPQTIGGITYGFTSWSDGGAATHEITTPTDNTTYTARFESAGATTVFTDDFEVARGWSLVAGRNTAPRGRWERGDPQATNFNGVPLQLETCDGPSAHCFITGLWGGNAVGSADVDEGMTSVQSPTMTLPESGLINLNFSYYFAHNNNASTSDYFRVFVVDAGGTAHLVFAREGQNQVVPGGWTPAVVNISGFAGETVRLRFEAADEANGSIIEAGFDNVTVTRQ